MSQTIARPDHIDLAGDWELTDTLGEFSCPMIIPGDVVSTLAHQGLIAEPYWGRNEYDARWVSARDWVITRQVELAQSDLALEVEGLDCVAEVRVNGTLVLEAQNAFRRYRADLSQAARVGSNTVEIRFLSPAAEAQKRQDAQPFFIPFSVDNTPIPNGNMLRKPHCDFGWDWNIALATSGIWEGIRLIPAQTPRIAAMTVEQSHSDNSVVVSVNARIEGVEDGQGATFELAGRKITARIEGGRAHAAFEVVNPDLWWPAGQGDQPLHDLTVSAGGTIQTRRIGFRDVSILSEPDAAGRSFAIEVNGRRIFCKGANWIPADALSGRIEKDHVLGLLDAAVAANMNMIRVWGGGRYEPGWFYDACDERGLMIWQDFMFACSLYPSTPEFLDEVRLEVRDVVERLHHHACLALWCGDNELIGALGWYKESTENRDRYLVNYDRLNRTLEEELLRADPSANWWPSSPSPGPLDFGDTWHLDGSGDMHFWSVWHENREFAHYRDISPRFVSEFGFQSYPAMEEIRRFCDPKDRNIASPVLESHQKNAGGNERIGATIFRYFRWPEKFDDFVYVSQIQQGLAIKTAVDYWRSLKPHCMGAVYWQLNDTWPVASWSSINHGGAWKPLHHMARRFFQPVNVAAFPKDDGIVVCAVNDGQAPGDISVELSVLSMDGETTPLTSCNVTLGTDAAREIAQIKADQIPQDAVLFWRWTASDGSAGQDHFAPRPYKTYDLADSGLGHALGPDGKTITLSATAPSFFATVEAPGAGVLSDNALLILPGQPVTLSAENPIDPATLVVRDLYSATMKQTSE